ncbi:unnamed protein product (mitochondrion) [Plasmodiophora brassicae]|uniref:Sugar phosphate transporter domain-containing protein n=1 Tax=Plasmodiophora brassicae TaxID=37360 RepID=A0A3P3YI86_PLABS|nr:unnamed protein product [Plasmodiophora brassicae]
MLHHSNARGKADGAVVPGIVAVWIVSSICGTLVNKRLMKSFALPMTLTIAHLAVGLVCDFVVVARRSSLQTLWASMFNFQVIRAAATVGAAHAVSKAMTFVSYGTLSLSLTHTIKSSSPIFAAIITFVTVGNGVSLKEMVSLLAISIGVTLSSFTEVHFELRGFLAAVSSCVVGVCQSMFSKQAMATLNCDPFVFHFFTTLSAMVIVVPPATAAAFMSSFVPASPVGRPAGLDTLQPRAPSLVEYPVVLLGISLMCHYAATIGSLLTLTKVSVLGHQVANVGKRMSIIVISIVLFRTPVSFSNAMGILIAMAGFSWFVFMKQGKSRTPLLLPKQRPLTQLPMASVQAGWRRLLNMVAWRRHDYVDKKPRSPASETA